jgi:hypothetical protein
MQQIIETEFLFPQYFMYSTYVENSIYFQGMQNRFIFKKTKIFMGLKMDTYIQTI